MQPEWKNCFYSNVTWLSLGKQDEFPNSLRFDSNFYNLQYEQEHYSEIKEWYRLEGKLFSNLVGVWRSNQRLELTKEYKWARRNDLRGMDFTAATIAWAPFSIQRKDSEQYTGLVAEYVLEIGRVANFSVTWVTPTQRSYGSLLENGSWDGLIGMVHKRQADFVAAGLAVTLERSRAIDFCFQWLVSGSALIMQDPTNRSGINFNWMSLLFVFTKQSWLLLGILLLLVCVTILVVHGWVLHHGAKKVTSFNVLRIILDLALPSDLDSISSVKCSPSKLLFMTSALAYLLIWIHYESMLTSFMTAQPKIPKIGSLSDIFQSDYSVIIHLGTRHEEDLKSAPAGSPKRRIYDTMIKDKPKSSYRHRKDVAKALQTNPFLAYYSSEHSQREVSGLIRITDLKDAPLTHSGLAFPKDSELVEFFNHFTIKMHQFGSFNFLKNKWIKSRLPHSVCKNTEESASALGYSNLILPTLFFWAGVFSAVFISLIETLSKIWTTF